MSVLQWMRETWGHFEEFGSSFHPSGPPASASISAGLELLPLTDAAVRFSAFSWFELI